MDFTVLMDAGSSVVGWLALVVLVLPVFLIARRGDVCAILGVGLGVRAAFVLYNTYISTLATDDFEGYAAVSMISGWQGVLEIFGVNSSAYKFFCTLIYLIFGRNPLLLQNINVALVLASMLLVIFTARDVAGWRAAKIIGWVLALAPTSIIYSSLILREAVVILPIVLGVRFWVMAMQRKRPVFHILALLSFGLATVFHYGCIALILAWALMPSIYHLLRQPTLAQKVFTGGLMGVASSLVIAAMFYFGILDALMPNKLEFSELSADGVGEGLQVAARGRASYLGGLVMNSPMDMAWQLPIRMIYLLLTPFPWMISSMSDVAGFADALIYLTLIIFCIRSRRLIMRQPILAALAICFIMASAVFSVGTSNYGTATRHRAKFLPLLCLVTVCAISARHSPIIFQSQRPVLPIRHGKLRSDFDVKATGIMRR